MKITSERVRWCGLIAALMFNTGASARQTMQLESTAFADHGEIPAVYTCEGRDLSPPLTWHGVPEDAKSLVLIVDDPDAPDPAAPKMTWVHWVVYNIPPTAAGFREGMTAKDLPPGAREGLNDWHAAGYRGPCPPVGRHRYLHKLFALDIVLPDMKRPSKTELEKAMKDHILERAELVGTYIKGAR